MTDIKDISDDELLEKLAKRTMKGEIKFTSAYFFVNDILEVRFETPEIKATFPLYLNVEKQFNYYRNYRNYCLPLVENKQKEKNDKELEILRKEIK